MNFRIHRGTNEIGGSCVEIWTETTRIVIDVGMPLVNKDGSEFDFAKHKSLSKDELLRSRILPNVDGLFANGKSSIDGLLISHAHQDHYGLYQFVDKRVVCYLGEATQKIIDLTRLFTGRGRSIENCSHFKSGKQFSIGDITVTPFLMDHSAFDAYAFLIEAKNKTILYSGDFRSHGRKAKAFAWFKHNAAKNVDFLLLEGTNISKGEKQRSESDVENEAVKLFSEQEKINLIYCSSQNIDRIVSFYRAALRTKRLFVVDVYVANVLRALSEFAAIPYPSKKFSNLRVYFPSRLTSRLKKLGEDRRFFQLKKYKITREEISENAKDIVMFVRPGVMDFLERIANLRDGNFIYSMWKGYEGRRDTADFMAYFSQRGFQVNHLHTSGHADVDALQEYVNAVKPKVVVPIHTFRKKEYGNVFGSRVREVEDGDVIVC